MVVRKVYLTWFECQQRLVNDEPAMAWTTYAELRVYATKCWRERCSGQKVACAIPFVVSSFFMRPGSCVIYDQ